MLFRSGPQFCWLTKAVSFKGLGEGIPLAGRSRARSGGHCFREGAARTCPEVSAATKGKPVTPFPPWPSPPLTFLSNTSFLFIFQPLASRFPPQNVSARSSSKNHPVQPPLNSWGSRGTGERSRESQGQSACLVSFALNLVQSARAINER